MLFVQAVFARSLRGTFAIVGTSHCAVSVFLCVLGALAVQTVVVTQSPWRPSRLGGSKKFFRLFIPKRFNKKFQSGQTRLGIFLVIAPVGNQ